MSDQTTTIEWTLPLLARFKKCYELECVRTNNNWHSCFTFDGHKFVLRYAKYLIEYLESEFAKQPSGYDLERVKWS